MKRRAGMICMILGAVLIGAALSLFLYNEWDSARAEERAEQVLEQMQKQTEDDAEEEAEDENISGEETERTEQENALADTDDFGKEIISIDGNDYIGWISIPSISLELPVMAQWSEGDLKQRREDMQVHRQRIILSLPDTITAVISARSNGWSPERRFALRMQKRGCDIMK